MGALIVKVAEVANVADDGSWCVREFELDAHLDGETLVHNFHEVAHHHGLDIGHHWDNSTPECLPPMPEDLVGRRFLAVRVGQTLVPLAALLEEAAFQVAVAAEHCGVPADLDPASDRLEAMFGAWFSGRFRRG